MSERFTAHHHGDLWTSAQVAHAFRVGVSSIKRWTDEGELESVRTPGGHRRYTIPALYRFAAIRSLPTDALPVIEQGDFFEDLPPTADITLYDALARGDTAAVRELVTPHVQSNVQRAAFLDRVVGEALREIGWRWERGELGIDEEHRASHMIAEAVDRLRPRLQKTGPLAILACPPGEWHDLPLRLVRLVFEWSGWRTEFAGATLPWSSVHKAVERSSPSVVAFSSRSNDPYDHAEFARLVETCRSRSVAVITGGEWARGGVGGDKDYLRFRTLRGFEKWLRTEGAGR